MIGVNKCLILFFFALWSAQAQYTLQWFSDEEGRVQWAHNCSFVGNDLGRVSRRNREECVGLCFDTPKCTRYAWTEDNDGTCRLRGGNEKPFFAGNGAACGYVTTEKFFVNGIDWQYIAKTRWSHNCYFTGPTIDTKNVEAHNCGGKCESNEFCIGFAWTNYQGGRCWLKSRGHPIVAFVGNFESISSVCGELSGRKASYGLKKTSSDGSKRKSEIACDEYKEIEAHYRTARVDPSLRVEFPWMAAVGYKFNKRTIFRCDGTIISDFYILVSAHCVDVVPVPEIVRVGTHILNDVKKIDMDIESITKHEHFTLETSFDSHKNDIALIKLKRRITFSDRIIPACLRVKSNDLPRSQELFVSGWEMTEEGELSNVLKKARLRTVDLQTCQAGYLKNSSELGIQISESQYCVLDPDRMSDDCPCPGDSGGPIQIFEKWQSVGTVVGIASFRKSNELPDVFTRVASFLDWIENKVWPD